MTNKENVVTLEKAWNQIKTEQTVWDHIAVDPDKLYFDYHGKQLLLSSIDKKSLPKIPENITALGKFLANRSKFANILSTRPGKEEVTFYAMKNTAHGWLLNKKIDQMMLNVGSPPLNWRRDEVGRLIEQSLFSLIADDNEIGFIDIGSGGGFDGIEILRKLEKLQKAGIPTPNCRAINIDVDDMWLARNQDLIKLMLEDNTATVCRNMSIFDYIDKQVYQDDLPKETNLIVSCNGFAEFFDDDKLQCLFSRMENMISYFEGNKYIIIPFAIRNKKQEKILKMVGFNYIARDRERIVDYIENCFGNGYEIESFEKYSQIVFYIQR